MDAKKRRDIIKNQDFQTRVSEYFYINGTFTSSAGSDLPLKGFTVIQVGGEI